MSGPAPFLQVFDDNKKKQVQLSLNKENILSTSVKKYLQHTQEKVELKQISVRFFSLSLFPPTARNIKHQH